MRSRVVSRRLVLLEGHLGSGGGGSQACFGSRGMQSSAVGASTEEPILVEDHGNEVVEVCLNRPSKLNTLTLEMVRKVYPWYNEWLASGKKMCVVMSAKGGKAFCAGGDVAAVRESTLSGGSLGVDFFYEEYQVNQRTNLRENLTQVSLWDGIVMGGGVGLSLHGAFRVATEKTMFAMPETAIGLFPDVGCTHALSRLPKGKALGLYLALTGVRLGPEDCMWSGLCTHYIPSAKLGKSLIESLTNTEKLSKDEIDSALRELGSGEFPPRAEYPVKSLQVNHEFIERCFGKNSIEEILQELEAVSNEASATDNTKLWAKNTLKALMKGSPTSVKVTFEAIRRHASSSCSFEDALRNEYRITQRMIDPKEDFFEGVRAVLIDRDNSPKWKFSRIEDVLEEEVERFFAQLPADHPRGELHFPPTVEKR